MIIKDGLILRREATEAKKKESPRTIKILVTVLPNLK
jgi:hypothetical protein